MKRNNENWINWLMVVAIIIDVLGAAVVLACKVAVVKFLIGM